MRNSRPCAWIVPVWMLLAPLPAAAADIRQPDGVVEMFTSQGCSSCPPADAVVTGIARDGRTLALAWHVDYWDYLGWKDIFAKRAHSDRQRAYARAFGEAQVYTPQAIVNGRTHVVGSDGAAVLAKVERLAGDGKGMVVPIDATLDGDALRVRIPGSAAAEGATLWMIYLRDHADVDVTRGENSGRKLGYSNIVEAVEMLGMVHGGDLKAEFRLRDLAARGHDSCALLLQAAAAGGAPGPILGAALIGKLRK